MAATSNGYAVVITQPGVAVAGASANQFAFNSAYPQMKLDTQNAAGFQTILLQIVNDPPEPTTPGTTRYTTLYKFKHGYTYVPSVETLFNVTSPPPGTNFYQQLFQDYGILAQQDVSDYVYLYAVADATYVYYIVGKIASLSHFNLLTGTNIQITSHVFVNDIGK